MSGALFVLMRQLWVSSWIRTGHQKDQDKPEACNAHPTIPCFFWDWRGAKNGINNKPCLYDEALAQSPQYRIWRTFCWWVHPCPGKVALLSSRSCQTLPYTSLHLAVFRVLCCISWWHSQLTNGNVFPSSVRGSSQISNLRSGSWEPAICSQVRQ